MSYDDIKCRRRHVLKIRSEEGLSFAQVALRFGIAKQTVYYWSKRIEEKKTRIKPPVKLDREALKKDTHLYPDAYQYERAARLGVSAMGIWHALRRLGVSYKKTLKHSAGPARRSAYCQQIAEYQRQGHPLVFMDESGFAHDMPRTHGYALKGQRCWGTHNWGSKGRTNVIGALAAGMLLTVTLFQPTINTAVFDVWIEQGLLPTLPPQSVVIMNNATFHKGESMKKALAQAGHTLLYLPPYSPDLNPIAISPLSLTYQIYALMAIYS